MCCEIFCCGSLVAEALLCFRRVYVVVFGWNLCCGIVVVEFLLLSSCCEIVCCGVFCRGIVCCGIFVVESFVVEPLL